MNFLRRLFRKDDQKAEISDSDETVKLSRLLTNVFSLDELHDLCLKLNVNYDTVPGETKAAKATSLVLYCTRPPRSIDEFIQACSRIHPDIPWDDPDSIESKSPSADRRMSLYRIINYCFNANELRDLCFDLGIDYEDLPRAQKSARVRELVSYYSRYPAV
jgi:hypothetical protein